MMKQQSGRFPLRQLALLMCGGILFYWMLNNLDLIGHGLALGWGLVFPFVLGCIFAFLLNLPMSFLERKLFGNRHPRFRRPLTLLLTILLLLAVIALVLGILLPELIQTVVRLTANIPSYIARLQATVAPYLDSMPTVQQWLEETDMLESVVSEIETWLTTDGGSIFSTAMGVATSIVGRFAGFFISLVLTLYLLLGKERVLGQVNSLLRAYLPEKRYLKFREIASLTYRTYANFVSGQFTEAVITGVMFFVVLVLGRFDYALLISVVVGLTSVIPMLGAWLGAIVGSLLLLASMGVWRMLAFIIITLVLQQIESNLIYPHVVGQSIGLPPLWILTAVTVGSGIGGIFGMLFFIPLFSVIYTLLKGDVKNRLQKKDREKDMENTGDPSPDPSPPAAE